MLSHSLHKLRLMDGNNALQYNVVLTLWTPKPALYWGATVFSSLDFCCQQEQWHS